MDNSKRDLDILSFKYNTELEVLHQIKECQHHLTRIEKLFLDLQKSVEGEREIKKSYSSLNNKLSKSFPDLQLLMRECETKLNSNCDLLEENCSVKSLRETSNNVQVNSLNCEKPLTFVIQVPNTLMNIFKKNISIDQIAEFLSQASLQQNSKSQKKKKLASAMQKLFRKKKHDLSIQTISEELLKIIKLKNEIFDSVSNESFSSHKVDVKGNDSTEKNLVYENSTNTEKQSISSNTKESQTSEFLATDIFEKKLSSSVKPNLCIQHEIIPQLESSTFTHSIRIKNDLPTESINKSKEEIKNDQNKGTDKEFESTEVLLNNLIKVLLKTTQKLDNLEPIKVLLEKLNEEKLDIKKNDQCNKILKTKPKKTKLLTQLLHIKANLKNTNVEKKLAENKSPQILKRQLSKVSVCSTSHSTSSIEELGKNPVTENFQQQKQIPMFSRRDSPSMFNYLVCPSERDIDHYSYY